ncbi:MAG: ABC transporter substrate-binding protein [Oleiphilaceae bacterium]|nr:ABC transporter substrate-binding protein [Oleiphilaceae bacterium]
MKLLCSIGLIASLFGLLACGGGEQAAPNTKDLSKEPLVRLGAYNGDTASLVLYANEHQLYAGEQANVQVKMYQSGKAATDALLDGQVDIATAAEFVVAKQAFRHDNLRVIAAIARGTPNYLLVNNQRIGNYPEQLYQRRFGVVVGSASEFYLAQHLERLGYDIRKDVSIVDQKPKDLVQAYLNEEIDALALWNPHIFRLKEAMPDKSQQFPLNNTQDMFFVLVTTEEWLAKNGEQVDKLLKALLKAEQALQGPDLASWLTERFELSKAYIAFNERHQKFGLSLNNALIRAIETEKEWLQQTLFTNLGMPDCAQLIQDEHMRRIAPGKVNIN